MAKGWAADRSFGRQVKALQAATPAGVSVYFRPHKGSASELGAFTGAIETLAAALPPGLVIVADSGLGYLENLCAADTKNVQFVAPLRADTGWAGRFDADVGPLGGLAALATLDYVSYRERRRRPPAAPPGRACCVPSRSPARTAPATTCAPPTPGPPKKPPPSPPPATAPWPRPRTPWPASATGSAAATTRPESRSTPASPRSSPARSPACSPSAPAPGGRPFISWARDQDAIAAASRLDGRRVCGGGTRRTPAQRNGGASGIDGYRECLGRPHSS